MDLVRQQRQQQQQQQQEQAQQRQQQRAHSRWADRVLGFSSSEEAPGQQAQQQQAATVPVVDLTPLTVHRGRQMTEAEVQAEADAEAEADAADDWLQLLLAGNDDTPQF